MSDKKTDDLLVGDLNVCDVFDFFDNFSREHDSIDE